MANRGEKASLLAIPPQMQRYRSLSFDVSSSSTYRQPTLYERAVEWVREARETFQYSRENVVLAAAVFLLVVCTATERVTYKMTVDRMLPYKFVLFQLIYLMSCAGFSMITCYKLLFTDEVNEQMRTFPQWRIFIMAVLDTLQFVVMTFAAASVSPTMTVVLMHASTPLVMFVGSRYLVPGRVYSDMHLKGAYFITAALLLGLVRPLTSDWANDPHTKKNETLHSLMYAGAAMMQGLINLYKEKTIVEWSYPINLYFINSCIFFYQIFITFIVAMGFHFLHDVFSTEKLESLLANFYEGWTCFLGQHPYQESRHHFLDCSESVWLLVGFVGSNLVVLLCIDSVLHVSFRSLGRATAAAVLVAFVALWLYDSALGEGVLLYGSNVGAVDVGSVLLLLLGLELYGRDPEPDVELVTRYAPGTYLAESYASPINPDGSKS